MVPMMMMMLAWLMLNHKILQATVLATKAPSARRLGAAHWQPTGHTTPRGPGCTGQQGPRPPAAGVRAAPRHL